MVRIQQEVDFLSKPWLAEVETHTWQIAERIYTQISVQVVQKPSTTYLHRPVEASQGQDRI